MLICPECQFENPNNHKFCQNCGMSLSQRVCPECGVDVATNAEKCHKCGAVCGTVRTALIVSNDSLSPQELEGESQQVESSEIPETKEPPATPQLMIGDYLDPQQRYQLLEPLLFNNTQAWVRVLDCQPYQITPLKVILDKQPQDVLNSLGKDVGNFPPLAQTYIALQSQLHKGIPPIHDAWQQDSMEVVLLEDRSHWQSLLQLWQENSTTSLQILECFYQITQLWELLEPFDACLSLLELSNLRLDEDQSLALQRLYVENTHTNKDTVPQTKTSNGDEEQPTPTLQALGKSWHHLFSKSQRTQFGSMLNLLADLEQSKIVSITDLQSRLTEIANELQDNSPESSYEHHNTNDFLPEENGDRGKMTVSATILQPDATEDVTAMADDLPTVNLPMQLRSLDDAGYTDVGRQRNHNEDCFGIETEISKIELPKKCNIKRAWLVYSL